ncbi:MAG: hypothetical protein LUD29_04085 [Clostridia bacterium]|nr:hypothetical protein [Clostridia bacterium]
MRKKIVLILTLICLAAACVAVAACGLNDLDELTEEGYIVQVTYDANGGNFGEPSLTLRMDLFNPDNMEEDEDGYVHIKLQDFSKRTGITGTANVTNPTRSSYGFWGWYLVRELYHDANGNVIDYDGNVLEMEISGGDEVYYYIDSEGEKVTSSPIYMYSERWDFDTSEIIYKGEDLLEVTLYAAWVPDFVFDFYYKDEKENYVKYGSTSFNYASYKQNDTLDDYIWLPEFPEEGGAMSYSRKYSGSSTYNFPKLSGYTFDAAYYDEGGVKTKIDDHLSHSGYVNEFVMAIGHVMNIYVEFLEGERYHIMNAEQFRDLVTLDAYLIIYNDLDFTDIVWPSALENGTFTGKIWSEDGTKKVFSNILVRHQTATATYGGLFGYVDKSAEISNIEFCDVTYDLYSMDRSMSGARIGLFAGDIGKGAEFTNVSLSGTLEFTIGAVSTSSDGNWINFLSNADLSSFGIDTDGVEKYVVSCYSNTLGSDVVGEKPTYRYNISVLVYDEENSKGRFAVTVDDDLYITYTRYSSSQNYYYSGSEEKLYYTKNYYVVFSNSLDA